MSEDNPSGWAVGWAMFAATMQASPAGVAIVAEADSPETTRSLSECLGRLGCYDGGVRVYWPRFRVDDDLRRCFQAGNRQCLTLCHRLSPPRG